MTPRALRSGIQAGEWTAPDATVYRRPPDPPEEWPDWRKDRMRVATRAAVLFLGGKGWQEIGKDLEAQGLLEKRRNGVRGDLISRARVAQYVDKGVAFLLQRGCFEQVKRRTSQ